MEGTVYIFSKCGCMLKGYLTFPTEESINSECHVMVITQV